jgi:hypothetical protein
MAGEMELAVRRLVVDVLGATWDRGTPAWLNRPGQSECGVEWPRIQQIYFDLTGLTLPATMPDRERRRLDAILHLPGQPPRILEVDEDQHFNQYRAQTLGHYGDDITVAFDIETWKRESERPRKLRGGGFAAPKPPLFPGDGGRHRQRAFRDALADILPPLHGYQATLRIAAFEVRSWIASTDARERMLQLLEHRLNM